MSKVSIIGANNTKFGAFVEKNKETGEYQFRTEYTVIADKYPVPALVLITELICRGYVISKAIDWSIMGINRTIPASDEEKIRIMKNFEKNDGKLVKINEKEIRRTSKKT